MAFDGITLNCIVSELKSLIGAKVDSIFLPDQNNLILNLYKENHYALDIDTSAVNFRAHLTTRARINPLVAPNFCMVLRKQILNYRIKNIYTVGLERILYIDLEGLSTIDDVVSKTLVIELMGKYSNIVLLNNEYVIIDALKRHSSIESTRELLPGKYYMLPESTKNDFTKVDINDFINLVKTSDEKVLDKALPDVFTGITSRFIDYAIDSLKITNTISDSNLKELFNYMTNIINGDFKCVKYDNNYVITEAKPEVFQVNFFLDDYYSNKIESDDFKNFRNSLLKVINQTLDKITRKLSNIESKIDSCAKMDLYKLYGELLTANIHKFQNIDFKNGNISKIKCNNYYDNTEIEIPIDINLDIKENAQKYYKKYNKLKNTLEVTQLQKEDTKKELNYLESILYEIDSAQDLSSLNTIYDEICENILFTDNTHINKIKAKRERFTNKKPKDKDLPSLQNYIKFKLDDYEVFVGKNNKQNDYLTKRVANENDLWFHVKDIHGSHLILRCNGDTPKNSTIEKCAQVAAYYSKAKFSSHVPVDYTLIKYVKKPNGSAPGYVIYTNNKTIYVDPKSYIEVQDK